MPRKHAGLTPIESRAVAVAPEDHKGYPMRTHGVGLVAGLALGAAVSGLVSTVIAQQPAAPPPSEGRGERTAGFPDLLSALRQVDGVLGVEAAQTGGGKQVIFAWFEDKAAAKRWYYSDVHRGAMERFLNMAPEAMEPLADVPDNVPILCIASVTPATKDRPSPQGAPFTQIAIEMYTPLPGGISLGGSFAPESLTVKGLERF